MKNFIKNKSIGYFIAVADAILALVLGIIYLATFKGAIGNNAAGAVPESIGIYLLAATLVEVVMCIVPQYRFVNVVFLVLVGLALYKETYLIPDFIAGLANGVEYNGGNAALNIFYEVVLLIIFISGIVASFMGFYKDDEEAKADFKNIKGVTNLAKIGGGAAVVIASVLVSTLVVGNLKANAGGGGESTDPVVEEVTFNPITDDVKALCDAYDYDYDPADLIIKEKESWDFSDATLSALTKARTREDHYIAYAFEGVYSEGYQGQYNEYYIYMWLWDDGVYYGTSTSNNSYNTWKGFWYNSSLANGQDESGNDIEDCLIMVSSSSNYASIICEPAKGFYSYQAYVYFNPGFASRSIIANGYRYYPPVTLAIDTTQTGVEFKVGDMFSTSEWTLNRILKNYSFGACFDMRDLDKSKDDSCDDMRVKWTVPSGLIVDGKFAQAGEFTIKASWGGMETEVTITVAE